MLINALWGGIKNNEIKRTVQKWVCEGALPDDLGNEEEMGGREGRPPQPYFLYINLSPLMIKTNSTTELIKGLMKVRKKYLSGRERGAGWKSTLLKYRQLQKDQPKRFLRDQAILTLTHKDRKICFMNQKMIADMSPSAFFWVTFFSIWHTFGTHVVVKA